MSPTAARTVQTDAADLSQRQLAKVLRASIDNVRDSVTARQWAVAAVALDRLLASVTIAELSTVFVRHAIGARGEWLDAYRDAHQPSIPEGAGASVEADRG